jgi:hypothetical protein
MLDESEFAYLRTSCTCERRKRPFHARNRASPAGLRCTPGGSRTLTGAVLSRLPLTGWATGAVGDSRLRPRRYGRRVLVEPTDPRERLALELGRVHDRLRSMSAERLSAPIPGHGSRDAAAHAAARHLTLLAQGVEQRSLDHPAYRELPSVPPMTVADQVAVCGTDLVLSIADLQDDEPVWIGLERSSVGVAVDEAVRTLGALRSLL